MTPPTLKQLIEKATPGPACPDCEAALQTWNRIEARMSSRGNFGIVPASPVCKKHFGRNLEMKSANAEIRARCSPAVMLAVVSALESCRWAKVAGAHPEWCMKYDETKVKTALNLLNGKAP